MICPELEDDHFEKWVELGDKWIELDHISIDMLVRISASYDTDYRPSTSSDLFCGRGIFRRKWTSSVDHE